MAFVRMSRTPAGRELFKMVCKLSFLEYIVCFFIGKFLAPRICIQVSRNNDMIKVFYLFYDLPR